MPQLHNTTPFAATTVLLFDEAGVDTLYIMVKATFQIGNALTLADEQPPPSATDVYWGEPGRSSVKYATDTHLGKPATDIVMLGHACAPEKKSVIQLDVSLTVGKINKTVRVLGDRQWQDGRITAPAPFTTMALVYEKAYGGEHLIDGEIDVAETRNPIGKGFAGARTMNEMNGMPLPNLEDPRRLICDFRNQPPPACFGFIAPHWQPRASFAGTYDDVWATTRAPFAPTDFDKRFFSMAHPDLIYPGFLEGGEPVVITNMHPSGPIQFNLPQVNLVVRIGVDGYTESPPFHLETVILEPNRLQASLVWRAAFPCDKRAMNIHRVTLTRSR